MQPIYQNYLQSQLMQQQRAQQAMALQQMMEAQQARPQAGQLLQRVFQPPAQPPGLPAPPGTIAGGPQAPPPGTPSLPAPPMQAAPPAQPVAAAMPPQPIPPFRALPQPMPPAAAPSGEIGAPPAPAAAPPPAVQQPATIQLPQVFQAMKQLGIPPEKTLTMLEAIAPALNMQNKGELDLARAHLAASKAAETTYKDMVLLALKGRDTTTKEHAEERKGEQGDERLRIMRENMENAKRKVILQYGNDQVRQELTPGGMKVAEELTRAGMPLPGGWSRNGMARGNAILNEMAKSEEGGAGSGTIAAGRMEAKGTEKAIGDRSKFVAAAGQFIRNMQSQMDLLEKYLKPGVAGGVPALNKWIQAGRSQIAGDPDVTALDTVIRGLAREHQRIVTGVTSNAQLHVAAQQTADQLLNRAQTEEQIRAAVKVMREEAENALKAGQDELKSQRGKAKSIAAVPGGSGTPAQTNAKGWQLMTDKNGNKAYVSPDKTQFEAVQ